MYPSSLLLNSASSISCGVSFPKFAFRYSSRIFWTLTSKNISHLADTFLPPYKMAPKQKPFQCWGINIRLGEEIKTILSTDLDEVWANTVYTEAPYVKRTQRELLWVQKGDFCREQEQTPWSSGLSPFQHPLPAPRAEFINASLFQLPIPYPFL